MKLLAINPKADNRPITNQKIQLQVKGRDGGYLSVTTDSQGYFKLDDKYNGQQITATQGGQQQWVTVSDGVKLNIALDTKATVK